LAIAAKEHLEAKCVVHFDERGLGFYAMGCSKGSQKPTVLITTSGTAVANLVPSCMEAYHSKTPLILLTADRPQELRQCGANQTTEQMKLFSGITHWQMDLSPHLDEKTVRSITVQAVFHSLEKSGPVQLNCPFQEPLYEPSPFSKGHPVPLTLSQKIAPPLIEEKSQKGVILLGGNILDPKPVLALAERLKWPVFADILSNARRTPTKEQIRHFHFILQSEKVLEPEYILYFGDGFLSKHILNFGKKAKMILVSPFSDLQDPSRRISHRVVSDIEPFCKTFQSPPMDSNWLESWQELDTLFHDWIEDHFDSPWTEAHSMRHLPSQNPIYLANSMSIRYADQFFFPENCPLIFANRGVSGIDGNIASLCGLSDALNSPITAFIGDQTALHDLNSFSLLKEKPILLIISNNFGGGIFDYLPSKNSPFLNSVFAASHAWNFEWIAKMFHLPYEKVETLSSSLPTQGVIELVTDRQKNHEFSELLNQRIALNCKKENVLFRIPSVLK
jgi:2-succinyl-5-enolpyruvyl-6-hydroxy-3-cyclohexene-1-carboxylate synthase